MSGYVEFAKKIQQMEDELNVHCYKKSIFKLNGMLMTLSPLGEQVFQLNIWKNEECYKKNFHHFKLLTKEGKATTIFGVFEQIWDAANSSNTYKFKVSNVRELYFQQQKSLKDYRKGA